MTEIVTALDNIFIALSAIFATLFFMALFKSMGGKK